MIIEPAEVVDVYSHDLRVIVTGVHAGLRRGVKFRPQIVDSLNTTVLSSDEFTSLNAEQLWWLLQGAFQITEGTREFMDLFDAANNAGSMLDVFAPRTSQGMRAVDHAEFHLKHNPPS